jgi:4-diphosphocytidyl-2-C-methyl-D-erythritol kinase
VFQAVSLFDEVEALPAPRGVRKVTVHGDQASLVPTDASNLALRAAEALAKYAGMRSPGVELSLRKTIPVTGGMAGGSARRRGGTHRLRDAVAHRRDPR